MVRRLVENEQIDLFIHQHTKPQPALLAAGQASDGFKHVLAFKQKRAQPVARGLHRTALFIEHGVEQRPLGMGEVNRLLEIRPFDRRAKFDSARAGLLPQKHAQKRRLARAVVAKQGDALAASDLQFHIFKQRPATVGLAEALDG